MGMYIGTGYGSIGKMENFDNPYQEWKKHENELKNLAKKHNVHIDFKSQDQGNDGYYLVILDSLISTKHVYQDSIFFMDLNVQENPDFEKRLDNFLEELWKTESLSKFHLIEFYEPSKLLFT